jgi:hypothetical protein
MVVPGYRGESHKHVGSRKRIEVRLIPTSDSTVQLLGNVFRKPIVLHYNSSSAFKIH